MPNTREKLIELLKADPCNEFPFLCDEKCKYAKCVSCFEERYADHLIANGVTAQEMDGCEYCKEDNDGYRTMFGAFSIANPCHGNVWTINTGHCKPRQIYFCPMCGRRLPQPPKGE